MELTDRQKQIYRFIEHFIIKNQYSPTYDEIGRHFEFTKKAARDHVYAIMKKGYLRVNPSPRTIVLIKDLKD